MIKKLKNVKKLMNLNFTDVTNLTHNVGKYDLPYVNAKIKKYPNYIAMYNCPKEYHLTDRTCVAFYNYDETFDGLFGIYNAIHYDIRERKDYYRERFKDVKLFIAPDYSLCGDINHIENIHRLFRARVVSVWLTTELNATVIPNITYSIPKIFPQMIEGMEDCEVVAFSAKGLRNCIDDWKLLQEALKYTIDHLKKLRTIIIYTTSSNDNLTHNRFKYAEEHKIKLIIPDNRLRILNARRQLNGQKSK